MRNNDYVKLDIQTTLKQFGGFVRYYDTTEPMEQLAAIVSSEPCEDILVCCGGGNQALTILGVVAQIKSLCAVDINAAQLFVLAGKISFLKQKNNLPSFEQLKQLYHGKIAAVKKNIRSLEEMNLQHIFTGKQIVTPKKLAKNYALIVDDGMFSLFEKKIFWYENETFISQICSNIDCVKFMHMDIFDSSDYFKKQSLDLIYLSDIYWQEKLEYYQVKLTRLVELLRPRGRIICFLDSGDDFMGQGISPSRMLIQQAKELELQVKQYKNSKRYIVLKRMKKNEES